jgi:hypothetical protein
MLQDSEKIRALVTFKKKLEKKIGELDSELKELQAMLETVDSILLEKGFKRGDMKKAPSTPEEVAPPAVTVDKEALHVLPDESKNFSVNTPPFNPFLVERVLAKMQEKDNELVRTGQLTPDKMFAYNVVREGDLIREIVIRNADEERLRELKSSIRWTLEKMYEKTKS